MRVGFHLAIWNLDGFLDHWFSHKIPNEDLFRRNQTEGIDGEVYPWNKSMIESVADQIGQIWKNRFSTRDGALDSWRHCRFLIIGTPDDPKKILAIQEKFHPSYDFLLFCNRTFSRLLLNWLLQNGRSYTEVVANARSIYFEIYTCSMERSEIYDRRASTLKGLPLGSVKIFARVCRIIICVSED